MKPKGSLRERNKNSIKEMKKKIEIQTKVDKELTGIENAIFELTTILVENDVMISKINMKLLAALIIENADSLKKVNSPRRKKQSPEETSSESNESSEPAEDTYSVGL